MDQAPDMIQRDINETRESLTAKLETLENQVRGTVANAKTSVEDTIASVKAGVRETVDTVKRTFDVEHQVQQHPFGCMAATLLSGFAIGYLVGGRRPLELAPPPASPRPSETPASVAGRMGGMATLRPSGVGPVLQGEQVPAEQPAGVNQFLGQFDEELHKIKELLIGAMMGLARDMAKESLPPALAPHVEQIMDSATAKLGGQPLQSPIIGSMQGNGFHTG